MQIFFCCHWGLSSSSPGWDMLRSSCLKVSPGNVLISSMSRRWPSGVRCQKQDFLFPSLHIWLQVLRKLLLKHRLCLMVFFQPSGAVWKKGKFSLWKKNPHIFVNLGFITYLIRGGWSLWPGKLVNLLDLEAPGVTALERQSDEDAVVDRRTRPASWFQVLKVLGGNKIQVQKF